MNTLLTLATASLASAFDEHKAASIVDSENYHFAGKSIENIHFGAGFNGCLLSNYTQSYLLNTTTQTLYENIQESDEVVPYYLRAESGDLSFVAGPSPSDAVVKDGYLTYNGSTDNFYSCKALPWDPYGYTEDPYTYGLAVYENIPTSGGCEPVKIQVDVGY